ncbi:MULTISPECIES: hypothetical protein [unclassified Mesorhizobium]|uniref:hypothetical protein n=1 Tax=unclassified Mesorhizobium TaxID=325217 RepID=UPI00333B0AAF
MKDERQLELNFDDPVEYLARPTYLGNTARSHGTCTTGTIAVEIKIRVALKTRIAGSQIGGEEKA